MALDGLVISNIVYELSETLTGGRINKIYQPEPDALILGIKNNRTNYKLLISASASLPLIYLTDDTPANPAVAPNFCMLLRKHINGGKILSITQPGLERILHFHIEHLNEMGDVCEKILIVELMGKHSNIIFCQPDMTIIDSIKHRLMMELQMKTPTFDNINTLDIHYLYKVRYVSPDMIISRRKKIEEN